MFLQNTPVCRVHDTSTQIIRVGTKAYFLTYFLIYLLIFLFIFLFYLFSFFLSPSLSFFLSSNFLLIFFCENLGKNLLSLLQRISNSYIPLPLCIFIFTGQRIYLSSQREAAQAVNSVHAEVLGWMAANTKCCVLLTGHFPASTDTNCCCCRG